MPYISGCKRGPPVVVQTALSYPTNLSGGSDIRLVWSGANLLPRVGHAAIWSSYYIQQSGYYALGWHAWNDGSWHASNYEFGTHPFPCDGTVSGGVAAGPTAGSGTDHYDEIAGLGALDVIGLFGQSPEVAHQTVKGQWVRSGRSCRYITVSTSNDTIEQIFCPDLSNQANYVRRTIAASALESPSAPAFYFGASDWTGDGSQNGECPYGHHRNFQLFNSYKTIAQMATLSNLASNAAVIAHSDAGSLWYCNLNPTPSDVTDKSGAGHSPSWANSNRPGLYTL